jgi:hypothetical protein
MRVRISKLCIVLLAVAGLVGHSSLTGQQTTSAQPSPVGPAGPASAARIIDGSAVLGSDHGRVVTAALAVLSEQRVPVRYIDKDRRLIRTGSVNVNQGRLRELTTPRFRPIVDRLGRRGGRYLLQIRFAPFSSTETAVKVDAMILLTLVGSDAVGGQILPSSMVIESEFLQQLAAKVLAGR